MKTNGITVNELILRLQSMVEADPKTGEMECLAEGCDCYGECDGARIITTGWTHPVVLISRGDA